MSTSLTHCRNCGHRLFAWDKYCSQCGQDTLDHPPTLWEFVHEWVLHYLAAEGKLWKSLWGLIAKPGFLTLEYLAGRKQRYVLPLRLVLTLGLVFFVAVKLLPTQHEVVKIEDPQALQEAVESVREAQGEAAAAAVSAIASANGASGPHRSATQPPEDPLQLSPALERQLPSAAQRSLAQARERWRTDPGAEARRIGAKMLAMAPYAVLLSLPFFAGLLKLLYWRQAYGAHFVFAMHLHAAWYAMLLLATLTPWALLHGLIWAWFNLYPVLALKRVHAGGWPITLLRGLVLALLHWALITLIVVGLLLMGVLSH